MKFARALTKFFLGTGSGMPGCSYATVKKAMQISSLVPRLSPHMTTTKSKEGESLVPFSS